MNQLPNPFLLSCEVISAHEYIAIAKYKQVSMKHFTDLPMILRLENTMACCMKGYSLQGYLRMNEDD